MKLRLEKGLTNVEDKQTEDDADGNFSTKISLEERLKDSEEFALDLNGNALVGEELNKWKLR